MRWMGDAYGIGALGICQVVLSFLPHSQGVVCSKDGNKDDICEICFPATHARNQFRISKSNAKNLFDLIHYDI